MLLQIPKIGRSSAFLSVLLLLGCSGGGDAPTEKFAAAVPVVGDEWHQVSVAHTFDADRAANIAASSRFRGVNADLSSGGYSNGSHPYELARLQFALSGGWNGDGQLVAVVDNGFRISHQEFSTTEVITFGNVAPVDGDGQHHGTYVAALIAGSDSVGRMMGVAPGADLHLTSYLHDTTRSSIDIDKLANATRASASLGAVAQNNSWGVLTNDSGTKREVRVSDIRSRMDGGQTLSQAYSSVVGGTASSWSSYFRELDTFQSQGVIVWAMSNDATLTENDASSALPLLAPELAEAWIAVGNGEFSVNSDHDILAARRLSARCGAMAASCIFADGTTVSASAMDNTSYAAGTGSSYAAPQVSGAIAILAQAFPSLSPEEWTKRLLATAYSDFGAFSADGTRDFGNGVVKAYSDEWGMGVLDIAAALSPIDSLSLVNGRTLSSASHSDTAVSTMRSGTATGDATRALLDDVDIAVFDALDTPFAVPASIFNTTSEPVLSSAVALPAMHWANLVDLTLRSGTDRQTLHTQFGGSDYGVEVAALTGAGAVTGSTGSGSDTVATSSLGILTDETAAVIGALDTGVLSLEHYAFAGNHATIDDGGIFGFGGGIAVDAGPLDMKVALLQSREQGGMLGMSGGGHFSLPGAASLTSVALSAELELTSTASVFGGVERGTAIGNPGAGYVVSLDPLAFSSFQLGFLTEGLVDDNDSLSLSVSQPLRVESGTVTLAVPAGRTRGGEIVTSQHTGALTPSGRQLDLGLNYRYEPDEATSLEFGAVYSMDFGHVAGNSGAAFAAVASREF